MTLRLNRLFVNRNVGLLFMGQVVSQAGDSIYQIGLLWLCLELTGSKSLTGLIASAAYFPFLIFALPGGALSDRFPRRHIMITADAARLLLVAAIPVLYALDTMSILLLGLLTFAVESFSAVFYPSRDALLPSLAPAGDLPHANALIQTSWQLAVLLGPAAAALLLPLTGIVHLFTADSVTFLASLLAIAAISMPKAETRITPTTSAWQDLKEGAVFALKDPLMRIVVFITAIDNIFLMGPAIVGVPVFVRDTLHLGASHYAWVEACYAGGIFIGAPLMARFGKKAPLGKVLLFGVILDGITYLPLFWVRTFWGTAATIFFHSIFIPMVTVSRTTLVQRHAPERLRGRMFSIIQVAVIGSTALSVLATGLLAEKIPAPWIFFGMAFLASSTALPGFFSRAIRTNPQDSPPVSGLKSQV